MATRIRAVSFNPYTGCTTGSFVGSAAVVAISPVEIELGRSNGVNKGVGMFGTLRAPSTRGGGLSNVHDRGIGGSKVFDVMGVTQD